jgi:cytosine/uracil/thiamine/allantoin permease
MKEEIVQLTEDVSASPLFSEDLAPVPPSKRTWNLWSLAAIWVGMAVCIPTYILASYMIRSGLSWYAALIIIGLANLIITIPMILNGHAGVKFGIPFPVLGRASFGTRGIHIAALMRGIVACGWFGIQTWIGGLAFYEIWCVISDTASIPELVPAKFICFGLFWLVNVFFIWKGTESIKWLEVTAAPILILTGVLLIVWGSGKADGFLPVLRQSRQLEKPVAVLKNDPKQGLLEMYMHPLKDLEGKVKATEFQVAIPVGDSLRRLDWLPVLPDSQAFPIVYYRAGVDIEGIKTGDKKIALQFRRAATDGSFQYSSVQQIGLESSETKTGFGHKFWKYLLWLTAMVGFWATMSLSISDITRYVHTQKEQVRGQLLGLPGTMILYSFVGIFVTCAAIIHFDDILIADDAPWDPVSLLGKFQNPAIVVVSQIFMLIATLSTNIAANVIAPANAFSNLFPKRLSFRGGGILTALIGILILPWWLLDEISGALIFVSGLLGPVLGVLICDYFVIRKMELSLPDLYKPNGIYSYGSSGFNKAAVWALCIGILSALAGYWVPALAFLYNLSWFTGFGISFLLYWILMRNQLKTGNSSG